MDATPGTPPDVGRVYAGPSPRDGVGVAAAYRRFLTEPGIENDFHAMRALAQRAHRTARERRRANDEAVLAEVEAARLSRADDEEERRLFGFATGTAIALGLALIDAVPAFLAAQAFGLDLWTTLGISAVLLAALAAAMWVVAHHRAGWRRWAVIGALAAGLLALGVLRWWYLVVTTGDQTSAVFEAVGLTVFTGLLVWFGVIVLGLTRPRHVSAAERRARSLRRRARRAAADEAEADRRADAAMRELVGRAQVFSSRELDDPDSRSRFLDHLRREVERGADVTIRGDGFARNGGAGAER